MDRLACLGFGLAILIVSGYGHSPTADEVAEWVLSPDHYAQGQFNPAVGLWPLACKNAAFVEGDQQSALLRPLGSGPLVYPEKILGTALPKKHCSIEAWVAVDEYQAWGGFLSALEDNGSAETGILLGYRNNRFIFALATHGADDGNGVLTYLGAEDTFELGRWYHVVGTYDGKTQSLYVNGQLQASSKVQSGDILYSPHHTLALAGYKDQNESYPLVGAIHSVTLHADTLSKSSIARSFRNLRSKLPAAQGERFNVLPKPETVTLAKLQPAINEAIEGGVQQLLRDQMWDGSFPDRQGGYRNGATGLALYTLIKCGLRPTHPAIVRGLQFLRAAPPRKVYSAGCQLLALGATGDQDHKDWAQEIVDLLLGWESDHHPGAWAYPSGASDLSNTQFAALGFWGASQLGIHVPTDVWQRMVDSAMRCQPFVNEVPWEGPGASSRSGKRRIAGFTYFEGGVTWPETGTMTTAGLCTLAIPKMLVGRKLGNGTGRQIEAGTLLGLGWLEHHYPAQSGLKVGDNLYYYLYGLERVGAFLGLEKIGPHPWYLDGAEILVKKQADGGDWGSNSNTCFALLFLRRASAASQSGQGVARGQHAYSTSGGSVDLRATGTGMMTLWVEGFSDDLLSKFQGDDRSWEGLRVQKVVYLADGQEVATVTGSPDAPWSGERFAVRHGFRRPGEHSVQVRVHCVPADGDPLTSTKLELVSSGEITLTVRDSPECWLEGHLAADRTNLLAGQEVSGSATSEWAGGGYPAQSALDGRAFTSWCAGKDDANPVYRIDLRRRVRANTLVLRQGPASLSRRNSYAGIQSLELSLNGKPPQSIVVDVDVTEPIVIDLGSSLGLRKLELSITGFSPDSKPVGISEIELQER